MRKLGQAVTGLALLFLLFSAYPLMAQPYPNQPIQLVITLAPGDSGDLTGRAIGVELSKSISTSVIPLNKTGGGGTVGVDFVAKAKKDGYTILYVNSNFIYTYIMNPENIPYNPLKDLEPLCLAVSVPIILTVQSDSPWKTFEELVNYVQKNPGKVRGCSTGVGSVGHFGYEVIRAETGAAITMVPYKGASPGLTALLGGHVEVGIFSWGLISSHFQAGKVRLLMTSKKIPEYPSLPTLTQMGYKRDMSSVWFGFFAPAGTPDSVKKILVSALEKSIKSPDLIQTIQKLGTLEDYKSPDEFKKAMLEEYMMGKQLLKQETLSK